MKDLGQKLSLADPTRRWKELWPLKPHHHLLQHEHQIFSCRWNCSYQSEKQRHSVERIPPPGRTVYVLYSTDRPDLDMDLNPNLIDSSLSRTQPVRQVLSEYVHNFLSYPIHRQSNRQTDGGENITSVYRRWWTYNNVGNTHHTQSTHKAHNPNSNNNTNTLTFWM